MGQFLHWYICEIRDFLHIWSWKEDVFDNSIISNADSYWQYKRHCSFLLGSCRQLNEPKQHKLPTEMCLALFRKVWKWRKNEQNFNSTSSKVHEVWKKRKKELNASKMAFFSISKLWSKIVKILYFPHIYRQSKKAPLPPLLLKKEIVNIKVFYFSFQFPSTNYDTCTNCTKENPPQ